MDDSIDLALLLVALLALGLVSAFVFGTGTHLSAWVWSRLAGDDPRDAIDELNERFEKMVKLTEKHLTALDERVTEMEGEDVD